MSIAVLVVTDGRDEYLADCVASARDHLTGPISEWWMYDDTGDQDYRAQLADRYPQYTHLNAGPRRGFGGAIQATWATLIRESSAEWIFWLEQDFTFNRDVDLADLAAVLAPRPHLVQMALRRQPWNQAEHAAGGVVEQHPDAYAEHYDGHGRAWLEHRLFWTTNPSLYRRSMCHLGWPAVRQSEGNFTHHLLRAGVPGVPGDQLSFGYWGARDSGAWVEHIGHQRIGVGY
jgi:Glycosyl transferase family 2